jgi:ribosomal protein L1
MNFTAEQIQENWDELMGILMNIFPNHVKKNY